MDFSRVVAVGVDGAVCCAHAQGDRGKNRNIRWPYRPNQQTAQRDLEIMRTAANKKSREEGFAAMAAEAKRPRDGKGRRLASSGGNQAR